MSEQIPTSDNTFQEQLSKLQESIDRERLEEICQAAARAGNRAEAQIATKHERKSYHNGAHTWMVRTTASGFMSTFVLRDDSLQVPTKTLLVRSAVYAASFHDTELLATQAKEEAPKFTTRTRGWQSAEVPWEGGNEWQSFLLGARFLLEELGELDDSYASEEEVYQAHMRLKQADSTYAVFMDEVEDGIRATVPNGGPMPFPPETDFTARTDNEEVDTRPYLLANNDDTYAGLRFYQPYLYDGSLKPSPSLTGLAVGTADLMLCGYAKAAKRFFTVGDKEMLETRYQTAIDLHKMLTGELDDPSRMTEIVGEIRQWIRGQVGFVLWQKLEAQKIGERHPALQQDEKRRQQFVDFLPYFDQTMIAAAKRADAFDECVANFSSLDTQTQANQILEFLEIGDTPESVLQAARAEAEKLPPHPQDT